jgi:hypothetical protein
MIRSSIHNLRTPDWQQVSRRDIERQIQFDRENDEKAEWSVADWTRSTHCNPHRSYLLTSTNGAIYAIFFRKT